MIQQKPKKCRGTGRAINFEGCRTPQLLHKYGLCKSCFFDWLYGTPEGKIFLDSTQIRAKKHVQKEQRKEHIKVQIAKKEETRQKKIDLMGVDKYRAEILQPIFNEIARLIDYQCPCIATGLYDGKMNGGHFHSVNSNRTIALNLHNIHNQSYHSNGPTGGGDNIRYRNGIIRIYGQSYMDTIDALGKIQSLHLTKWEMVEIKDKASAIRIELKADLKYRTPQERIALREEINQKIGVYK